MSSGKDSDLTINSFLIPRSRAIFGAIRLKSGISPKNYYANIAHNMLIGFLLAGVELLQKNLLADPKYYNLTNEDRIHTSSTLTMVDLCVRVIFFPVCGMLIDRYGRRKMNIIAFIIISFSIACFPLRYYSSSLFPSIWPWLYIIRAIYAVGSSILVLMPFLGDYIENEYKGRAMCVNSVLFAIGILLSTLEINILFKHLSDLFYHYMILLQAPLLGIITSMYLKRGAMYYQMTLRQLSPTLNATKQYRINPIRVVIRTIRRRPWITVGFIFSLIGGMDLGLIAQALVPFHTPFTVAFQFPPNYSLLAAALLLLIIEVLLDFCNVVYLIYLALILGIGSYSNILIPMKQNDLVDAVMSALFFISCLACVTIVNYLDAKYCPRIVRGHSYGLKMMTVALGMLLSILVNKYIHVKFIAIYIVCGSTILGLVLFPIIYCCIIKRWENRLVRKNGGTGIRTLLDIEGIDKDLLENSEVERNLLHEYRLIESSHARQLEEPSAYVDEDFK